MSTPTEYRLKVNFDALIGVVTRRVAAIIERTSFGLLSADPKAGQPLELPIFFRFEIGPKVLRSGDAIADDYRTWLLTCGFRDCIEAVSEFLEELRLICAITFHGRDGRLMGEDWNEQVVGHEKKFHRLGLPDKFAYLASRYKLTVDPQYTADLLSLNSARNCLVHRRGVVTAVDANNDQGLLCRWRKFEIIVTRSGGERPLGEDRVVGAGEALSLRRSDAMKHFALGDTIQFTAEEFSEMCMTLVMFAQVVVKEAAQYAIDRGLKVSAPSQAQSTS